MNIKYQLAMYYKIEKKECKIYQDLHEMRTKELEIEKENQLAIKEKTGLEWESYLGYTGQQNFRRVTQYSGFKFLDPDKVDLKIWQSDKNHEGVYIPNLRTKLGREISNFLLNGLKGSLYSQVFDILNLEHQNRFTFPFVEIIGDVIILFISDSQEPKSKDVIEITKKEFSSILDQLKAEK